MQFDNRTHSDDFKNTGLPKQHKLILDSSNDILKVILSHQMSRL